MVMQFKSKWHIQATWRERAPPGANTHVLHASVNIYNWFMHKFNFFLTLNSLLTFGHWCIKCSHANSSALCKLIFHCCVSWWSILASHASVWSSWKNTLCIYEFQRSLENIWQCMNGDLYTQSKASDALTVQVKSWILASWQMMLEVYTWFKPTSTLCIHPLCTACTSY